MLIKNMTIKDIADATYTVSSTLIRIAKKLNYNGWNDLKTYFLNECEYLQSHFSNIDANLSFKNNGTIMSRIKKEVHIHSIQNEIFFNDILASNDSYAIIISYSGETYVLDEVVKILKEKNIPIIVITSIGDNTLSRNGDCVLRLCIREKLYSKIGTFSTDSAITYLLDVLYACYFSLDYENNLNLKIETRFSTVDILKEK